MALEEGEATKKETITRMGVFRKTLVFEIGRPGKYSKIREQNERETETCRMRDRSEMQSLIDQQLSHRQRLQQQVQPIVEKHKQMVQNLREEIAHYMEMGEAPPDTPHEGSVQLQKNRDMGYIPEL